MPLGIAPPECLCGSTQCGLVYVPVVGAYQCGECIFKKYAAVYEMEEKAKRLHKTGRELAFMQQDRIVAMDAKIDELLLTIQKLEAQVRVSRTNCDVVLRRGNAIILQKQDEISILREKLEGMCR